MTPGNVSRALAVASALLLLAACTAGNYPLQMHILEEGKVEHRLSGEMAIGAGAGDAILSAPGDGLACDGVALVGYAVPGCASSGSLRLECSDGRTVTADWEIEECRDGQGTGEDSLGNEVTLLVGDSALGRQRKASAAPDTPPASEAGSGKIAFMLGGGFAAGFDLAPAKVREQGWQVAMSNRESGLVIATLDEPAADASLLLADTPPARGSEVFVVTSDSVVSASLASNDMIEGAGEVMDGLPVLNIEGKVIGMTRNTQDGLTLFSADRLRRYLQLLEPALENAPPESLTPAALRERIVTVSHEAGSRPGSPR